MMKRMILLMLTLTLFFVFAVPVNAGELTETGSVGTTVSATTSLQNKPAFKVSIPSGIPIGTLTRTAVSTLHSTAFSVSVSDVAALTGRELTVMISTLDGRFCLYNGVHELPYEVRAGGVEAPLVNGGIFARFNKDSAASASGSIIVDQADIRENGTYSGTLIFTVKTETRG